MWRVLDKGLSKGLLGFKERLHVDLCGFIGVLSMYCLGIMFSTRTEVHSSWVFEGEPKTFSSLVLRWDLAF